VVLLTVMLNMLLVACLAAMVCDLSDILTKTFCTNEHSRLITGLAHNNDNQLKQ